MKRENGFEIFFHVVFWRFSLLILCYRSIILLINSMLFGKSRISEKINRSKAMPVGLISQCRLRVIQDRIVLFHCAIINFRIGPGIGCFRSGSLISVLPLYKQKTNERYKMNIIVSLLKALHAILNIFSKENSYQYTFQTERPRNNNTTSTIRLFFIGGDRLSTVSRLFVKIPNFFCIKGKVV